MSTDTATPPADAPEPRSLAALRRRRLNRAPKPNALQAILDSVVSRINPAMRDGARKKIEQLRLYLDGSIERARDDFKALAESQTEEMRRIRATIPDPAIVAALQAENGDQADLIRHLQKSDAGAAIETRDRLAGNIADAMATIDAIDVSTVSGDVRGQLASVRALLVR